MAMSSYSLPNGATTTPKRTAPQPRSAEGHDLFAAADALLSGFYNEKPPKAVSMAPARPSCKSGKVSYRPPSLPPSDPQRGPRSSTVPLTRLPFVDSCRSTAGDDDTFSQPKAGGSRPATPRTPAVPRDSYASEASPSAVVQEAASTGLWEAVEELKRDKDILESELKAAESRAEELQTRLARAEAEAAEGMSSRSTTPQCEHVNVREALLTAEAEREALKLQKELLASQNEALRTGQQSLSGELEEVRRDRAALQEKLEVFLQAIALEQNPASPVSKEPLEPGPGLREKIERLHSQLVLESVSLRNEVATLKKKRWVLKAVLANGGASEQEAIDAELAKLIKRPGRAKGVAATLLSP